MRYAVDVRRNGFSVVSYAPQNERTACSRLFSFLLPCRASRAPSRRPSASVQFATFARRMYRMPISCQRGNEIDLFAGKHSRVGMQSAYNVDFVQTRQKRNRRSNDLPLDLPQDYVAELLHERGPRGRGLLRDSITHPYHGVNVSLQR